MLNCTSLGMKASFFVHGKLEEAKYEVVEKSYLFNEFIYIRLQAILRLVCENTATSVADSMTQLRKKVNIGLPFNKSLYLGKFNIIFVYLFRWFLE